jgi:hypothetical protein
MLAAISVPVTPAGYSRAEPSGSVIITMRPRLPARIGLARDD